MWGRVIGVAVSLGIIVFMFHTMMGGDAAVQNAIDNSPEMKEQKQMLRDAGVNPDDPQAVKKYTEEKAKEIEKYQHSADDLIKDK